MKKTIKFINDFHRTEITIPNLMTWEVTREAGEDHEYTERFVDMTPTQISEVVTALCGCNDCTCGGIRGEITGPDGEQYTLNCAGDLND